MSFGAYAVVGLLIIADIITGILKAGYEHNIKSTILRKGLYHKISEILGIAVSTLIEYGGVYINFNLEFPVTGVVLTYIGVMEIVSILENICSINPNLFKLFQKYLHKGDDNGD